MIQICILFAQNSELALALLVKRGVYCKKGSSPSGRQAQARGLPSNSSYRLSVSLPYCGGLPRTLHTKRKSYWQRKVGFLYNLRAKDFLFPSGVPSTAMYYDDICMLSRYESRSDAPLRLNIWGHQGHYSAFSCIFDEIDMCSTQLNNKDSRNVMRLVVNNMFYHVGSFDLQIAREIRTTQQGLLGHMVVM